MEWMGGFRCQVRRRSRGFSRRRARDKDVGRLVPRLPPSQLARIDQERRVRKAHGSPGISPKARKNGNQAAQRSPLALMDQTDRLAGQALQKGRSS